MSQKKKVVIIGAGFGGLSLVKALKNKHIDVLIIDQNNYHNFQPLMYQVATGGLEPNSIAYPVRRIFRHYKNVSFRMAKVEAVDPTKKQLDTSIGAIAYDYLIVATGSETNYYNFEPVKAQLLTLKSIPDALNLRSFIFQNLERALVKQGDDASVEAVLNIAIVGGGPAGIELAGALAEMKRHVIPKDFPDLEISKMSINLYEASSRLLSFMSEEASHKTLDYLHKLGINVHLNSEVKAYDGQALTLADAHVFKTDTVIWTAGVKGNPIKGLPEAAITGHRILVDDYNRVKATEAIFAIGDVAAQISEDHPNGLPMLAPVAQQQGKQLARNIMNLAHDKPLKPFRYLDKGIMATIGRNKAVVDLPKYKFQGTFAWLVWMFVHIFLLVGFRNKLIALIDWMTNYFTYDRPLGLIIRSFKKK